jgi:hypothetical protein
MSDFRYLDALLQPKFEQYMLYRLAERRRAYEVSIIFSVCLLKPFSVFNHAERGFFYGLISVHPDPPEADWFRARLERFCNPA